MKGTHTKLFLIFFFAFRRNRVVPRTSPRMAAQNTADAEVQPFDDAVDGDGFYHILRAGRPKTADARTKRREKFLVKFNRPNQQVFQ